MSTTPQVIWDATPQPAVQVSWDEPAKQEPQPKKSLWQRIKDANKPAGEGGEPSWWQSFNPLLAITGQTLGAAAEGAKQKADETQNADLVRAARGEKPRSAFAPHPVDWNALSSTLRMASGFTQPKSLAITGAAALAPEAVGPALAIHGGSGMVDSRKAFTDLVSKGQANPDDLEKFFTSGAEAAGGAATTGAGLRGGVANTNTAKVGTAVARGAGRAIANVIEGRPPSPMVPEAAKALTQATQPGVNIPRAQQSIPVAGARIKQLHESGQLARADGSPIEKISSTGDLLDAVTSAKRHVWDAVEQRMGPVAALQADTSPIADAMESSISKRTTKQFGKQADAIRERANTYRGTMSLRDIEEAIQDGNDDLRNFYKRPMANDAPISADMAATQAEVKALRSLLDEKVETLSGDGVRDLKGEYGSLRDLERATAKQHAINTRTKEGTLWEGLAYMHAAGDLLSGNPLSAARAAGVLTAGRMLKTLRNPDFLIEQSFHGPKAFAPAEPIAPAQGPPTPKGLLPQPATEMPGPADTSGSVRGGRWTTPKAQFADPNVVTPQFIREIRPQQLQKLRGLLQSGQGPESNVPPIVDDAFTREEVRPSEQGSEYAAERRVGATGRGGVRLTPKAEIAGTGSQPAVRTFAKEPPAGFEKMLQETGWEYGGKNSMGIHEFKQPGSDISISVLDKNMNPEAVRGRIDAKLREFGKPGVNEPPKPSPRFTQEAIGNVEDPKRLGARGEGGVVTTPKGELPSKPESLFPEEARMLIKSVLDSLRSGDRPGRYYSENELGDYNPQRQRSARKGVTSGGHWFGVQSGRDVLPWIKDTDFTPADLERAVNAFDKGKMTIALRSAIEYVKREAKEKEKAAREPGEDEEEYRGERGGYSPF